MTLMVLVRKFYVCFGYQFSESYIFGWLSTSATHLIMILFWTGQSIGDRQSWPRAVWVSHPLVITSLLPWFIGCQSPWTLLFLRAQENASSIRTDVHFILVHLSSLMIRITDSVDMNLGKLWKMVRDKEAWHAAVYRVTKSRTQLGNWTKTMIRMIQYIQ